MKIKLIDHGLTQPPKRQHYNDAGADVYAMAAIALWPHSTVKMPLGFGLEIPDGFAGFVFPRGSLAEKGITCQLPPIDSGYRGEIHAILTNASGNMAYIQAGDRIGQLVILPCVLAEFVRDTGKNRGEGAFGHTGK